MITYLRMSSAWHKGDGPARPSAARPRSRPQPAEHASLQVGVFRSGDATSHDRQSSDLYEIAAEPAFTGTPTLPNVLLKSVPMPAAREPGSLVPRGERHHAQKPSRPADGGRLHAGR